MEVKNSTSVIKKRIRGMLSLAKFKVLSYKTLEKFDPLWIRGKRVALVGSADSACKEILGDYIDGFDVVVRLNKGVELVSERNAPFIGTRTDLLFHCFYEAKRGGGSPVTLDLWKQKMVGRVVFCYNEKTIPYGPNLRFFYNKYKPKGIRIARISLDLSDDNFKKVLPFHPTTGFIALNTLLNCAPAELYVTGMTFFKTPFMHQYRDGDLDYWKKDIKENGVHDPEIEYQAAKKLYLQHPDVFRPDATLKEIFDTN